MVKSILILAYGNPSRGDDALAPLLLEKLQQFPESLLKDVECIVDFQLQIEHALDLKNRGLVLFADASVANRQPVELMQIHALNDNSYTTHAMSPQAVMQVYQDIEQTPPPCFLMSLAGESFELGESLSQMAEQSLEEAKAVLCDLLTTPALFYWQRKAAFPDG